MKSPKILFSAVAMSMAFATAPAAFAQDAAAQTTPPPAGNAAPATSASQTQAQGAAAQSAPTAQSQGAASQAGTPAGAAPQAKQVTWADLDTDQNGKLSKAEVAPMPALTQSFEQVDTDKDGQMTPDEYKAFAQKQQTAAPGGAGGGQR